MSLSQLPDHGAVLSEVREVRRAGIVRLRELRLPVLAGLAGCGDEPHFPAVERLLRAAVAALDDGTLREAAEYSLGLARGTRDWPGSDRRRRAAQVYGLSVERFRRDPERRVLGQVAEQLLRLAAGEEGEATGAGPGLAPRHRELSVTAGRRTARVTLHVHPVDLLRDIDAVVSPVNTHLALPEPYKSSVAASLRRAGADRDPAGRITEDRIGAELRAWAARNAPHGLPVAAGTVAGTGAGALAAQGVRRVYHAAVAVPRPGTNDYDVLPGDVTRAVTRVFRLLADDPGGLRSVCLPLLGAGRGGLSPAASFAAVWAAVEAELARGGPWDVHFLVRRPERADLLARLLPAAAPGPSGDRP
ncbi:hypothetical protein [Streptomyces sp. NPDC012888]|uniref:hypothetical protein n=1 Tax=Streptomyces sp. NPDC012888 TaxID=3364855 RepID=UPI00369ED42C